MSNILSALHARTLCNATEEFDRVEAAMMTALGEVRITISKTEGHHGNPITVLEATVDDPKGIEAFFKRLSDSDIETVLRTLDRRVDEGCNLFLKLDKQAAFKGSPRLGPGDDVISIRMRIRVFPAKCDKAKSALSAYLAGLLDSRRAERDARPEDRSDCN